MELSIDIKKSVVYDEVQKTTSYIGSKKNEEKEDPYTRIAATDSDVDLLERYWRQACASVVEELKPFVLSVSTPENSQTIIPSEVFTLELQVSDSFEQKLVPSLEGVLKEFFINKICCEWLAVTGDKESDYYKKGMEENREELRRILYYRKRPSKQ